ncbi:hypothetical protein PV08_03701 [Exophiala spinifera]|uniref:NIMA interactive protein n=1 Tax=Exophiala spinifera TaxID=91928 RepID=A0A0D1YVV2_9EURO|nr:uncharacterized protein PV08_03701 [Exophiala spinifera]KIW19406.1 hypothetical protein PV08_03701 [Exophiala spinifera]
MDSNGLERASQYLNNLLLARGLLTSGKPIDFAKPDRHGRSCDATMSRVINLVHDLVLRRDQDAEQRENLALNMREARADESQRLLDLQRLQDKNAELVRQAATAEAQERTLRSAARRAEAQAKELKEQMLKMKSTLDQVRAKCLSDVRKRDVELDKLKGHLASIQRGKKDSSGMKINVINFESEPQGREKRHGEELNRVDHKLEMETNDFLACIFTETSSENVSLRRIITETMEVLRDLTDMENTCANGFSDEDFDDGIGIPGQDRKSRHRIAAHPHDLTSCDTLAEQMATILEHCRTILKDPSFVPIEEVQLRDEEIIKLRIGWEKMANRWRETVTMMDNWRRKIGGNGESMTGQDFTTLQFGKSVAVFPDGQPIFGAEEELSSILYENATLEDTSRKGNDNFGREHPVTVKVEEADRSEEDVEIPADSAPKRRASSARKAALNVGKPARPLRAINHNIHNSPSTSLKSNNFSKQRSGLGAESSPSRVRNENDISKENEDIQHESREMTVPEKLAVVEAEAAEVHKHTMATTNKRKHAEHRFTKRATRRRSTLSPDELAELMGIH